MMAPLDGSIVSVSLPAITTTLKMDYALVIWVPTGYLVTLAVLLLIIGRLSDIRGRKSIFIAGFSIFVLGSFLCSIAQTGLQLILFRILQGAGGAFIASTSTAIVTDVFPSNERGKALGINIMAVYIGGAIGPTLGGILTHTFGWRSIFWVNIPIGLLVIFLSLLNLKESKKSSPGEPFDVIGAIMFSIGLVSLLIAMTFGEMIGWTSLPVIALFTLAFTSFALFVPIEVKKGESAMFNLALIVHNRLFAAANISALMNYTAFFAISFTISFYLQKVLLLSPMQAGLVLLSTPVAMTILTPISGWASDKIGSRILSTTGMLVIVIGLLLLSTLNLNSSPMVVITYLLIVGCGMGLFSAPNTSAVMGSVGKKYLGVASGMIATMRTTGMSLSLAVTGAVIATVASSQVVTNLFAGANPSEVAIESAAYVNGMSLAFIVCAGIAAIGAIFSLLRESAKPTSGKSPIVEKKE
jgi:EmrB/QacA subfamily drug resistance transporter